MVPRDQSRVLTPHRQRGTSTKHDRSTGTAIPAGHHQQNTRLLEYSTENESGTSGAEEEEEAAAARARRSVARLSSVAMEAARGEERRRRRCGLGFMAFAGFWLLRLRTLLRPVSASYGSHSGVGKSVHCWRLALAEHWDGPHMGPTQQGPHLSKRRNFLKGWTWSTELHFGSGKRVYRSIRYRRTGPNTRN